MNFLFVLDKYYPKPYANAICAQSVIDDIKKDGHTVKVIAFKTKGVNEPVVFGNEVEYVKPDLKQRLFLNYYENPSSKAGKLSYIVAKCIAVFLKILFLSIYPLTSFSFPRRIRKVVCKNLVEEQYDAVVTTVQPFDGAYALYRLKKSKKINTKWITIFYDTLDHPSLKAKLHINSNQKWVRKFEKYSDGIVYMASRKDDYKEFLQGEHKDIFKESDIPLFVEQDNNTSSLRNHNEEHWYYFGSLSAPHYDPHYLIEFFLKLPNDKKRVLHFYGRGNYFDYLKDVEKNNRESIVVNDYIDVREVIKIEKTADVLVSIKSSVNISAKIFEYFSTNNNVLHFSSVSEDVNCGYVEKYPKGLVIKTYENNIDYWIQEYADFMKRSEKCAIVDNSVFIMNTPKYTKDIIISFVGGK